MDLSKKRFVTFIRKNPAHVIRKGNAVITHGLTVLGGTGPVVMRVAAVRTQISTRDISSVGYLVVYEFAL